MRINALNGVELKFLVVYNNNAGGGRAKALKQKIIARFEAHNISCTLFETERKWHAMEEISSRDLSEFDGLIACGGDGTHFEVVTAYYNNNSHKKPTIGVVPLGTGNAFVKELGLQSYEWEKAIDIIVQNKVKKIDAARLETEGKTYHFVNVMGAGFVADVGFTTDKIKFLGEVSYVVGVLLRLIFLKNINMTLEIDGKQIKQAALFVEVCNSVYTGAKFIMAPGAKVDDGLLDVIVANKISRLKILRVLPKVFSGKHVEDSDITVYKARHIKLTTQTPKILIPDGELLGSTPFEVTCLKQDISYFWK